MWPFKPKNPTPPEPKQDPKDREPYLYKPRPYPAVELAAPVIPGVAMDSKFQRFGMGANEGIGQLVGEWYANQRFIGHAQAAWIAKHWLVDKAINMPVRDALRQGWELDTEVQTTLDALAYVDKKHQINERLHELATGARRTGGAVAILLTCPDGENAADYYAAPLNVEAVNEYHGIAVVDAADAQGEPLASDLTDPASLTYMTPAFYRIGAKRYHASHCVPCVPYPVADLIKPAYQYWGASLPERIYERVYAAERTANEAPLLTMTKRLRVLGVDLESVLVGGSMEVLQHNVQGLQQMADNLGVFVYDTANGGGLSQLDTGLADVDTVIMTQYQLCASIAEIPVTKLLGTTPKGFNATGEAEAEDYRQHLESLQTHDMQPLLEMHYKLSCQVLGIAEVPSVTWLPLDSPTASEFADIDAKNAATVGGLVNAMVITPAQGAEILSQQKESMFFGVEVEQNDALEGEAEGLLDGVFADLNADGNDSQA